MHMKSSSHSLNQENTPIVLHHVALTQFPEEGLVMSNDDKLEITLVLALIDNSVRTRKYAR